MMNSELIVAAFYFDGKSSRRHSVTLAVRNGLAVISGDVRRECAIGDLRVSERFRNARRKVTFPDGAYLEILDPVAFDALLARTGFQDSFVVRMQQSWRSTLMAFAMTASLLVIGYLYALPAAADLAAKALPESVEHMIGKETLAFLDKRMLTPSALDAARQQALISRFRTLVPPADGMPAYAIVFRKSRIGPNAFALPSGHIVLTDELVNLVNSDDAVIAVLAHELGHLHERHLTRRLIQGSMIGAGATLLFGDVSSVIANIPTVMLDLKYSRDAEREADDYALAMLKKNGIDSAALIRVFEALEKESDDHSPYLSSHPPASERIARIRGAK
ncbi:M48 family metallopeptidase [Noviherbaspirillum sp. ST9]|uniref:M48 family metallopeptidase n=1 Tax=Noviherbaspirillum sp. ST9 TaxID=3401606 RepID=UPI003B5881BE